MRSGDRLYAIGGHRTDAEATTGRADEVYSTPLDPDGRPGAWRAEAELGIGRAYGAVVPWRGGLAIFGGEIYGKGIGTPSIEALPTCEDEPVWRPIGGFPGFYRNYPIGAAQIGDRLYLSGWEAFLHAPAATLSDWVLFEQPSTTILGARGNVLIGGEGWNLSRADVAIDGGVSPWTELAASEGGGYEVSYWTATVLGPRQVYIVGGRGGAGAVDEIWAAPLCADP